MIFRLFILTAVLLLLNAPSGQCKKYHGYLGHKNYATIGSGFGLMRDITIAEKWYEYEALNPANYRPVFQQRLTIGRSILPKYSLQLSAYKSSWISQTSYRDMSWADGEEVAMYYSWGGYDYLVNKLEGECKMTDVSFGFGIKQFRPDRGAIAPLGGYFIVEPRIHFNSFNAGGIIVNKDAFGQRYYEIYPEVKSTNYSIHWGFGKTRMLFNLLYLDYGVNFTVYAKNKESEIFGTHSTEHNWYEGVMLDRLTRSANCNIHASLGFVF